MAKRPVFIPNKDINKSQLVNFVTIDFIWHPGFAPIQKKKNVVELHSVAQSQGLKNLLEVSTKSDDELGKMLSAFRLEVNRVNSSKITVESAYQGSKIFREGGPYNDLYNKPPAVVKKDLRLKKSGGLVGFEFEGIRWGLEPVTAFYNWLYLHALAGQINLGNLIMEFDGFTDIEFNPAKSIASQAYSCALFVALKKRKLLDRVLSNRLDFLEVLKGQESGLWRSRNSQFEFF